MSQIDEYLLVFPQGESYVYFIINFALLYLCSLIFIVYFDKPRMCGGFFFPFWKITNTSTVGTPVLVQQRYQEYSYGLQQNLKTTLTGRCVLMYTESLYNA